MKRCFDVVFAGTVLFLSLPILIVVSIALKLTSDGRVIYKQVRIGRYGRVFYLYKFRTMYSRSDSVSTVTVRADARITPLGAHLRRWKVDEPGG